MHNYTCFILCVIILIRCMAAMDSASQWSKSVPRSGGGGGV